MRKTTPEITIVICDVCGNDDKYSHSHHGGLIIKRDALDFSGAAVADASVKRDLCNACLLRIEKAINNEAGLIKKEKETKE